MTVRCATIGSAAALPTLVTNIIVADPTLVLPGMTLIASETAHTGDSWDGHVFTPAPSLPPPIPQSVMMWQLQAALAAAGLTARVAAAVTAASATNPMIAGLWQSLALPITRTSPTLEGLATAVGITAAQLDALFVAAAAVSL